MEVDTLLKAAFTILFKQMQLKVFNAILLFN